MADLQPRSTGRSYIHLNQRSSRCPQPYNCKYLGGLLLSPCCFYSRIILSAIRGVWREGSLPGDLRNPDKSQQCQVPQPESPERCTSPTGSSIAAISTLRKTVPVAGCNLSSRGPALILLRGPIASSVIHTLQRKLFTQRSLDGRKGLFLLPTHNPNQHLPRTTRTPRRRTQPTPPQLSEKPGKKGSGRGVSGSWKDRALLHHPQLPPRREGAT